MDRFKGSVVNQAIKVFLLFSAIFAPVCAQAYCSAKASNASYEWIGGVNLAGYNFPSGSNSGYGNFTNQVINLAAGANSVSLTPGFRSSSYTETWRVWIDFNQDDTFASDEVVFSGSSSGVISGNITVPSSANNGSTRMRVIMQFGGTPQPCTNPTYGEVEDYSVFINNKDVTSPTVINRTPAALSSNIAIGADVSIKFSEKIDPLSVSNASVNVSHNGVPITGSVTASNDVLRFVPSQAFAYSSQYTVIVYAGIMDLAGNPLQLNDSWTFSTEAPDVTAPVVLNRSPAANEKDVSTGRVIQIEFSEPINSETINATSFQLLNGGQVVAGNISLSSGKTSLQFYPAQALANSTEYTVKLAATIKDLAGNSLTESQWNFTTMEYQLAYCSSSASNYSLMWMSKVQMDNASFIYSSQPNTGYSFISSSLIDFSKYFSKSVQLTPGFSGSSPYTVYWRIFIDWNQNGSFATDEIAYSGTGKSLVSGNIVVPAYALSGKTRMRVSLQYGAYPNACGTLSYGEVKDYRINILAPAADTTPPGIVNVSPVNNAQIVPVGSSIDVKVTEDLLSASTSNALTLQNGNESIQVSGAYNSLEKKVVFTPSAALKFDTTYTATLSGLKDTAGNAMVGDYVWSFVTESASTAGYTVSGNVKFLGANMPDVQITLSGNSASSQITNVHGNFLLTGLVPGDYLIIPSKAGYNFSPVSQGVTIVDGNIGEISFAASAVINALINGGFEQGNFNGFNSFTTANGTANKTIVIFDTDNDGSASTAAHFSVGVKAGAPIGINEGGGIYQIVGLNEGSFSVSVDVAATASSNNGSGGIATLLLDGQVIATHDFGSITGGVNEYATLNYSLPNIISGNHEIRVLLTRPYAAGSVAHYVDDIFVSGSSVQGN